MSKKKEKPTEQPTYTDNQLRWQVKILKEKNK